MKKDSEIVFNLVCKLAQADLNESQVANIRPILYTLSESSKLYLIKVALDNQSLVLLHHHHRNYFPETNLPYTQAQLNFLESVHKTNVERVVKTNDLLAHFNAKGLKLVLLKGSLFSQIIYKNPYYKKMNDLDLLLDKKDELLGISALKELKYQSIGDIFNNFDLGEDSHHTPPFISHDLKCITGLHWGLNSKHAPFKINHSDIFNNLVPIDFSETKAWRMSWEDNLIHLCVHLPFYKIGVRELADVANMINKVENEFDWEKFKRMSINQNLCDPVYRVLTLAQAIISFTIPSDFSDYLLENAYKFTRIDTQKRVQNIELLLSSRCTHIAKIEKYFVVFKLATKLSEKLGALIKMYQLWFFCESKEMKKIIGVLEFKTPIHYCLYRIKTPLLIWRAMARDHGNIPLAIVTLQNLLIAIVAFLTFPVKKDGISLKEHKFYRLLKALE